MTKIKIDPDTNYIAPAFSKLRRKRPALRAMAIVLVDDDDDEIEVHISVAARSTGDVRVLHEIIMNGRVASRLAKALDDADGDQIVCDLEETAL